MNVPASPATKAPATKAPNRLARYWMGSTFVGIGALHFVRPESFEAIIPDELPAKTFLVYATGVMETAGGIQLIRKPTRRLGVLLTGLLLLIFPANINQALRDVAIDGLPKPPRWALFARLPLQALMIWAVLAATRPTPAATD